MLKGPLQRTVRVPGLDLAALAWGDDRASHKVLAIHGWLDNAATFATLAPHLSDVYLVAIDLPGHGRSEHRSANDTYHFVDWIPDVVAAADALGFQRFSLIGHSMGGAIASVTAGTVPSRVRSLVLLDGVAPYTTAAADAPETLAKFIQQRTRLLEKKRPTYASLAEATQRLLGVTALTPEAARLLTERNTRAEGDGVVWTYDPRLRYISPMRFTEEHNRAFLRRIAAPVLLVRPDRGIAVDPVVLADWLDCIRDLTRVSPSGGHHLHLEAPQQLASDIDRFLAAAPL